MVDCCGELLGRFPGDRVGAVEDCHNDNQGNCVGKGKLRVLGAFRDSSESVGSHDSN